MVVDLYGMTAAQSCVVKGEILRQIIEVSSYPVIIVIYNMSLETIMLY